MATNCSLQWHWAFLFTILSLGGTNSKDNLMSRLQWHSAFLFTILSLGGTLTQKTIYCHALTCHITMIDILMSNDSSQISHQKLTC